MAWETYEPSLDNRHTQLPWRKKSGQKLGPDLFFGVQKEKVTSQLVNSRKAGSHRARFLFFFWTPTDVLWMVTIEYKTFELRRKHVSFWTCVTWCAMCPLNSSVCFPPFSRSHAKFWNKFLTSLFSSRKNWACLVERGVATVTTPQLV